MANKQTSFICPIYNLTKPDSEHRSAELVYSPISALIKNDHPDWGPDHAICLSCLNKYRTEYVEDLLENQRDSYAKNKIIPTVYETCDKNSIELDELEKLFPDGYHRGAVKIAGLRAR